MQGPQGTGAKAKYVHKNIVFAPVDEGKATKALSQQTKNVSKSQCGAQKDNLPAAEISETVSTFPALNGPEEKPSPMQRHRTQRANLDRQAIAIVDKISPPQPTTTSLETAMKSSDAKEWAKAWNTEVLRRTDDLKTWNLEEHHCCSSNLDCAVYLLVGNQKIDRCHSS